MDPLSNAKLGLRLRFFTVCGTALLGGYFVFKAPFEGKNVVTDVILNGLFWQFIACRDSFVSGSGPERASDLTDRE